ncbi:hypothetical protein HYW53_02610 [Candidatus Giovannonibacteria bacterium]|nr:hypothetical protein [Candidatus Giovannonibacteria bacterium]
MPLSYYTLSLALGGFIALISSFFVLFKGPKQGERVSWFLLSISSAMWSFGYYFMISANDVSSAFIANKVLHQGAILIAFFYLVFILFLTSTVGRHKYALLSFALLAVVFSILNFSDSFIRAVFSKYIFNFAPDAGPLYIYFTIYFFAPTIYAFLILFHQSLKVSFEDAQRFKYVLGASLAGFVGGGSVFFLTFNINVPPYPVALFSLYPIIITYTILRFKLFNIRVVATELLVFTIWVFLLVRTILDESLREKIIDGTLLALVIFFGILLIRSVLHEVKQREEIQKLAEDLEKANEELKKLDKLKSEFVSLATHQLRTPLTIIKGYISMLQENSFGEVPEKIRDVLRKVYLSNERLINLVNDFLNLSRIESGRMRYNFETGKVEDLVANVVEEFQEVAKDKKLSLTFEPPKTPLPEENFDKEKFRQVVTNIVDNAIKYTEHGSVNIKVQLDGSNVLISVKDTGIGMTSEELGTIFKRFSRGEGGYKVNTEGTGLGLYLAKKIVSDHGGDIWAESKGHASGSTFWIKLPVKK